MIIKTMIVKFLAEMLVKVAIGKVREMVSEAENDITDEIAAKLEENEKKIVKKLKVKVPRKFKKR